jgi:rhamnogalacturonan endolyase
VSNTSDYIDISFSSTYGDLHWVIYPNLAGAYQYFVNKALPDISIFRTLWRLDPARFTNGYTTTKDAPLPDFSLYANATKVQDETFQLADGSYVDPPFLTTISDIEKIHHQVRLLKLRT